MEDINNHLVEIRYKPNPRVLDYRGSWADSLSVCLELPKWKVIDNRADIWSENGEHRAFVSFRNAGYYVRNAPTKTYFPDHASKFLRHLFELEGFGKSPSVIRIGVRSRFCRETDLDFAELVKRYSSRFVGPTERASTILDAELLDIGSPLNLKDARGFFNLIGGPMQEGQIVDYMQLEEPGPKMGLLFDIDYWLEPGKKMVVSDVIKHLKAFSDASWAKNEELSNLILGKT